MEDLLQSGSKLVGAGCRLFTAADSLESRNDVFYLHAADKGVDPFEIAVATSGENYFTDYSVVDLDVNTFGTGSGSVVMIFHDNKLLRFDTNIIVMQK